MTPAMPPTVPARKLAMAGCRGADDCVESAMQIFDDKKRGSVGTERFYFFLFAQSFVAFMWFHMNTWSLLLCTIKWLL